MRGGHRAVLRRRLARSDFCFYKVTLAAVWRINYKGARVETKSHKQDRKGAGRDVHGGPVRGGPRKQAGEVASAMEGGTRSPGGLARPLGRRLGGTGWQRGGDGLASFPVAGMEGPGAIG